MSSHDIELEVLLEERPVCFDTATTLPSVFTEYLDLLLQKGTENFPTEHFQPEYTRVQSPEKKMQQFECVHCLVGNHELLIPIGRIQRIEKLNAHHEHYRLDIPDCSGESHFVLKMMNEQGNIYVHSVREILWIQSEDLLWRDEQPSAPWFVGTHKSLLCRLFDPDLLA